MIKFDESTPVRDDVLVEGGEVVIWHALIDPPLFRGMDDDVGKVVGV